MSTASLNYATLRRDGIDYEAIPATIARTDLGWEDHGLFSIAVMFQWGSAAQGMPGYSFGNSSGPIDSRLGEYIRQVLKVAGVERWEDLRGQRVYILKSEGMIRGLAHIDQPETNVFIPADLFADGAGG